MGTVHQGQLIQLEDRGFGKVSSLVDDKSSKEAEDMGALECRSRNNDLRGH